ncbi:hypothetical protein GF386_01630 [Candidatus Pacearchaeota archaeon]|nr:hypothetical protein [Candidatus Pacearchaeota archaeon]MBD3282880.1 hypothetical protein [Candidatus Pacearchaeota archaeon]
MDRVLFKKGEQRKFLDLVIERIGCFSLRGILQFGFNIKYSTLKNYYIERRTLPRDFFEDLCYLARIDKNSLKVRYIRENWGQVKGGKKGKAS